MNRLQSKVAVIIGAAGENNMGQEIARSFAAEGARVVVAGRNQATLGELAMQIQGRHCICDITRKQDVVALCQAAVDY